MNTHQARKTIGFIFSILILGLTALNPISVHSNPIYYGMWDKDTSVLGKHEPENYYDTLGGHTFDSRCLYVGSTLQQDLVSQNSVAA